tara:strand:+ start:420 stop:824 length:405 start_codon:yes stop_codon:yes gene_type:complete
MNLFIKHFSHILFILSFFVANKTLASCRDYPYTIGTEGRFEEEVFEVISTSEIKVLSDYQEDVIRAFSRADAESKIGILRFFYAFVDSDGIIRNPWKMSDSKNSSKIMSSIVMRGRCYEPNKFVRVTNVINNQR